MASKTEKTSDSTERDEAVIDLADKESAPTPDQPSRHGLGDLLDFFPSLFNQRWPEIFTGSAAFEPMKVEEFVDDDTYVIRAEIPGVDPEEAIDIAVDRGRLTIKAEREERSESKETDSYRSEFHYGSFRRSMRLPAGAEPDDVRASYTDGILEVRVPIGSEKPTSTKVTVERTR